MGYQHSNVYELPNPATSRKQIIPLVPGFAQDSDPSGIIQPSHLHDQGTDNLSQTRLSHREQVCNLRGREDVESRPLHPLPGLPFWILRITARNPRGPDIHMKREEDVRRRLLRLPNLHNQNMTMVDIKEFLLLHRFQRLLL